MSNFTIDDIPGIEPASVTEQSSVTEIPQSDAPPMGMFDAMGGIAETLPDQRQIDFDEQTSRWKSDSRDRIDTAVLDPEKAFQGVDLSFSSDKATAQRGAIIDAWMALNLDEPTAPTELQRKTQFQAASFAAFGELAGSEEELYPLIEKDTFKRRDTKALTSELTQTARVSATVGNLGEAGAKFQDWKVAAKGKPGYDAGYEADYFEEWHKTQRQAKESVEPYKAELSGVWKAMKAGGAGSPSTILKELLPFASVDGNDLVDEVQKKDAGVLAFEAYDKLTEAERPAFLNGLAVLIQQFPKEERPALLASWGKQFGGVVDSMFRGAATRFTADGMQQWIDEEAGKTVGPYAASDEFKGKAAGRTDDMLKQRNFMDAVRKMERDEYSPTPFYSDPSEDIFSARMVEKSFYGSASVVASVATMAIPYIGKGVLALAMEDFAYGDLRDNAIRSGASEMDASRFANDNKTLAAVPQIGIEILQNNLALGRLPGAQKVLTALGDKIKNRLIRGVVNTATFGGVETAVEEIQYEIPYVVQDLSHALEADTGISAAVWSNGTNGALDGFWNRQATTFLSMLPLAGSAAMGGINRDARNEAFARATTTELQAFGGTAESIAAINAANGPASLNAAVDGFMGTRDPNSEEAEMAAEERGRQAEELQKTLEAAQNSGMIPRIVSSSEGYDVMDHETGKVLATATDMPGAMKIAMAHNLELNERKEQTQAYLASLLEGADQAIEMSGDKNAKTSVEVSTLYTQATAAAEDPHLIDTFAEEAAMQEQVNGGDGQVSFVALGQNKAEVRGLVRTFTNRLFEGASVTTAVHETFHGMMRRAEEAGQINRGDKLAFVLGVNEVMGKGKLTKGRTAGLAMGFLPEGIAEADITDKMLNEAISHIAEVDLLKTRKIAREDKRMNISGGIILRNLLALSKLMGSRRLTKFRALIDGARGVMGLASARKLAWNKAIREGRYDMKDYDAFMDKMHGRDYQAEHDGMVRDEVAAMVGQEEFVATEDAPFSLVRIDAEYLELAKDPEGNRDKLQAMVDGAAKKSGFTVKAFHGTGPKTFQVFESQFGKALWFSENRESIANGESGASGITRILPVFLKAKKPAGWDEYDNLGEGQITGRGFDSIKLGDDWIVFEPNQIKSADPVTYDESGEVIPLSQRFDSSKDSISFSLVADYGGGHRPMEDGPRAYDLLEQEMVPSDVYDRPDLYSGMSKKVVSETMRQLRAVRGKASAFLTIYRAGPRGEMNNGDWVTLSKEYARTHADAQDPEGFKVWEAKVKAADVRWAIDDLAEFGYFGDLAQAEESDVSFSLVPSSMVEGAQMNALSRIKDPKIKRQMFTRMVEKLGFLKRDTAEIGKAFGKDFTRNPIEDPRGVATIRKDYGLRKEAARERLELDAKLLSPEAVQIEKSRRQALRQEELEKEATTDDGIKAAKAQAKAEFVTWARDQRIKRQELEASQKESDEELDAEMEARLAEEKRNYAPKARLLRALAMYEAMLSVLPPEVRGRMGGYVKLATIETDEKRLEFLFNRLEKMEVELDKYLGKQYAKMLEKIIEKSKPRDDGKGGKKRTGKIGFKAHEFFEKVTVAMKMTDAEVSSALAIVNKEIENQPEEGQDPKNLTEAELIALSDQWQILNHFGNFSKNSLLEKGDALDIAAEVYTKGKTGWTATEEARLAESKKAMMDAKAEAGGGGLIELQQATAEQTTMLQAAANGHWTIKSFREVTEFLFGEDSKTAKRFVEPIRRAFQKRTSAMVKLQKEWTAETHKATGKKGREAMMQIHEMQAKQTISAIILPQDSETIRIPIDTFFDATKKASLGLSKLESDQLTEQFEGLADKSRVKYLDLVRAIKFDAKPIKLTEAQAIHITMLWAQAGYQKGLTKHGYGEDFQTEVEAMLSPAAKVMRDFLATYYRESFPDTAKLYREMFGVNLRQIENYAPGTFWFTGTNEMEVDPSAGIVSGGSFRQGQGSGGSFSQGSHKQRSSHTAAPRLSNAFDMFFSHANQAEHWKALAPISREMNAVFGNPEVKIAMEARSPEGAAAIRNYLKVVENNGIQLAAPGKFMQMLMDNYAFMAMSWKVSTATKNFVGGALNQAYGIPLGEYVRGIGRLHKLDFAAIRDSEIIQNKLFGGNSPEMRAAISKSLRAKPTRRAMFMLKGMEIHAKADAYGNVIGGAIAYDYFLRQAKAENPGASEEQIKAMALDMTESSINRLSQPSEVIDRSLFELNSGWAAKLMFLYRSEARQKSSMYISALGNAAMLKPTAKDLRVLFISHLVMAPIMTAITRGFQDAFDPEDEEWRDEKHWNPRDYLIACMAGPLAGIPLLAECFSAYTGMNSPLFVYTRAGNSLVDLFKEEPKGDELSWYSKKITSVLSGIGASPGVAANIGKQVIGAVRNVLPD